MRVFISYSGEKGKKLATRLMAKINTNERNNAWTYDDPNYTVGRGVWDEIYSEIINREYMVVIIDESAEGNVNQENEYTNALKNGEIVFAFVKNGIKIPDKLKSRSKGYFDEANYDDACDRLINDLGEIEQQSRLRVVEILQNISNLESEVTKKLLNKKIPMKVLGKIQDKLQKDLRIRPNNKYQYMDAERQIDTVNAEIKRMGLSLGEFTLDHVNVLLAITWALDAYNKGLPQELESNERFIQLKNELEREKIKISNEKALSAVITYLSVCLGINSLILFQSYFPQSYKHKYYFLNKPLRQLEYDRDAILDLLLQNVKSQI